MKTTRKSLACFLCASLALGTSSCLTSSVESSLPPAGAPQSPSSVRVTFYENRPAARKREPVLARVVESRLVRVSPGAAATLEQHSESDWSVANLSPGRYRVEILDPESSGAYRTAGRHVRTHRSFTVKSGEQVHVDVILNDSRGYVWAAVAVGAVAVMTVVYISIISSLGNIKFGLKDTRNVQPPERDVPLAP